MDFLKTKNSHERDEYISFEPGPHKYTVNGDTDYVSVTTWIHRHFQPFDSDKIIENMMKSRNWSKSEYYGMTPSEIKATWKHSTDLGTIMHDNIERFYNECLTKPDESTEFGYFLEFNEKHKEILKPYRTEWMIYNEDLRFSGSIDMIFEDKNGDLHMMDWKRSKKIRKAAFNNASSTNPIIEHLPDSNYWHYCLQLNTYKRIIEEKYNKKIKSMHLVCLHPNNENKTYQKIKVVDLQEEVKELFEERLKQLNS